ncbi:hypothetical protein AB2B38_007015 [Balneola sp. MJW-20]|uniref:hypothetical protein n=1 Tax=Gracilimonas aurantiaca TaxID=3234185 RepID=UPI0034671670
MILILIYILTAFLMNLVFPWWTIVIPGLILGYRMNKKTAASFGAGFLAIFLLWFCHAAYIHIANEGILATRIAEMLQPPYPWFVVFVTGLIGGVVGGMSVMTGSLFKSSMQKAESS